MLNLKPVAYLVVNLMQFCFVFLADFCGTSYCELFTVLCRSTSSVGVFRDQGLSNSVVVKFIVEFDKLFQHAGETACTTSSFLQWVSY